MATPGKPKPAPKAAPDFALKPITPIGEGVELSALIPPERTRTRNVRHAEIIANLQALQDHPNEPYEIAHYAARPGSDENPSGAKKIVQRLLLPPGTDDRIAAPEVEGEGYYDIEWRSANYDGSDRKGSVIVAMFVTTEEKK